MSKSIPEVLKSEELERLLATPNARCATGCRNRALMAIMADCGLREAEAIHLEPRDIDMETGRIHVHEGKGKRDRILWAGPRTVKWIQEYCAMDGVGEKLFTTLAGHPINPRYIREMVKRYAVRAGLDDYVHPHTLRHTFATDLYKATKDIALVSKALGHTNIATTMIYVHIVDDDEEKAMKELRS
jgi:integrase/recombinase XerD